MLLAACALPVILTAAGPWVELQRRSDDQLVLLDVSPSIPAGVRDAAVRRAAALVGSKRAPGDVRWAAFGKRLVTVPDSATLSRVAAEGRDGPTDLLAALDAAGQLLPSGGRVLLLTDGRHVAEPAASSGGARTPAPLSAAQGGAEVDPALLQAAAALGRAGVRLWVLPLWPERAPDVAVQRVDAPRRAAAGTVVLLEVSYSCRGELDPAKHQLQLLLDDAPLQTLPLTGPCDGQLRSAKAELTVPAAGRPLLAARRAGSGSDLVPDNDRAGSTIEVTGPARVLWLGDEPAADHPVRALLRADGHVVERRRPERLAAAAGELGRYDLVLLDDVAAHRLVAGQGEALSRYVRGGGGLLVLGGPAAYGAGGYPGTALDALLPVSSDPRRASGRMAAALLVDKSGSMGGYEQGWERLLLAKETLRSLLATLGRPDDEVGVWGFDTRAVTILPLTRVDELDIEGIDTGAVQAGGGTDPSPALEAVALELEATGAPVRQIIVISDGRFAGPGVEPTIREMVGRGIHLSAIGIGDTAEMSRLEKLATLGRGGVSRVLEARHLPRAVLQEMLRASGGVVRKGPVVVEPGSALPDLRVHLPLPVPELDAINRTLLREGAARWLQSGAGDPVLAAIRRGAGLAIAFTGAPGRWSSGWAGWPGEPALWRAVIDAAARRPAEPWEAEALVDGDRVLVRLLAIDAGGVAQTGLLVRGKLVDPRGEARPLLLTEAAPGLYQGPAALQVAGRHRVNLEVGDTDVAALDVVYFTPAEVQHVGNDQELLEALAAASGGRLLGEGDELGELEPATAAGQQPLSWALLALAALLLLLYLAVEGRRPTRRAT